MSLGNRLNRVAIDIRGADADKSPQGSFLLGRFQKILDPSDIGLIELGPGSPIGNKRSAVVNKFNVSKEINQTRFVFERTVSDINRKLAQRVEMTCLARQDSHLLTLSHQRMRNRSAQKPCGASH
jgi:hypothetical protein